MISKNNQLLFDEPKGENFLNGLEKIANNDLGPDASTWISGIRAAFEQQHPELIRSGGKPSINFNHRDTKRGDATGSITITVNSTYMVFPLTIRDGILSPFDSVFVNKHWHYADKELITDIVNSYNLFLGSEDLPKDDAYSNVRWNRFDYRPSVSGYLALGKTAGFEEYGKQILSDFVNADPYSFSRATPAFKAYAEKISSAKSTDSLPAELNPTEFDIMTVRKSDLNRYVVKLACKGCNGYIETEVSSSQLRKLAQPFSKDAQKLMDEVDAHPADTVLMDRSILEPAAIPTHPTNKPGMIHSYGVYRVLREDGGEETGVVFPMVNWNFSATDKFLFLGPQSWSIQREMAGHPSSEIRVTPNGELSSDVEGCFTYDKNGRALATPPIKILSVVTTQDGTSMKVMDINDMKILHLILVPGLKAIIEIDPDDHADVYEPGILNLYIPAEMKFTPLPPCRTKIIPDPMSVIKISSDMSYMRSNPYCAILTRDDISAEYVLDRSGYPFEEYPERLQKMAGFRPYPKSIEHLGQADAGLALLAMGLQDPVPMLKEATETGSAMIGLPSLDEHASVIKMKAEKELSNMIKMAKPIFNEMYNSINDNLDRNNILKIAASVDDEVALDKLFNLSFFGKDTISYFASRIDILNDAEELLVKLLLASRLARVGVEEASIKQALEGLSDIQEGFKGLALKGS